MRGFMIVKKDRSDETSDWNEIPIADEIAGVAVFRSRSQAKEILARRIRRGLTHPECEVKMVRVEIVDDE